MEGLSEICIHEEPFGYAHTDKRPSCYLSGPMTGLPDFNVASFEKGTSLLLEAGWDVFSPHEHDEDSGVQLRGHPTGDMREIVAEGFDFGEAMKWDLEQVRNTDVTFVMPGWEESAGARIEVSEAHRVGKPVYTLLSQRKIEIGSSPELLGSEQSANEGESGEGLSPSPPMREFGTGAIRNRDEEALGYEGFLSPIALKAYAEYMHKHRFTADGNVRDPDNWQKGIPLQSYMESLWRHMMDLWLIHRGYPELAREELTDALSGLFFNVQGYMHESLK